MLPSRSVIVKSGSAAKSSEPARWEQFSWQAEAAKWWPKISVALAALEDSQVFDR